ncbi:MAG: HNH endonuclease, partial [Saprospiraceae bacterium]
GLHHPGNIVPLCANCNKRRKDSNKEYLTWQKQLELICKENNDEDSHEDRERKILFHMNESEYKYPILNENEKNAIRVIANSLYNNIKSEGEKSLKMYQELDKIFVKK